MTTYGDGFGAAYVTSKQIEDNSNSVRTEKIITTQIGEDKIRVILRDKIVSFDPYLVLVRASLYPIIVTGKGRGKPYFPAPPTNRKTKDALIKVGVDI